MTLQFDKNLGVKANAGLDLANKLNTKVDAIQTNGGGVNLLVNSLGKFQPNKSAIDNFIIDYNATVHLEHGQQYTLHATASDGLVWGNTHDTTKESNNVVLWVVGSNVNQIISDANTGTRTTFTWDQQSGDYPIRINTYKVDNSGYVEKIMIEKGTVAHDWSPNPNEVKLYKPYVTNAGDLHAKLINADGTDATQQ